MLLRFSAGNHLSLREPVELSLVASSLDDSENGLIDCKAFTGGKLLPAAIIYGANASGKSNVISALQRMTRHVLHSHNRGDPSGGVPYTPFALDPAFPKTPASFEADFIIDDVRYHYGFTASDEVFLSETLYAFPNGRMQKWFERKEQKFTFGRGLSGPNKLIESLTRKNSLFVSAAAQNNHPLLLAIYNYFESIYFDHDISVPGPLVSRHLARGELDHRIIPFLDKIGTGVVSYKRKEINVPEGVRKIKHVISAALKEAFKDDEVGNFEIPGDEDKFDYIQLAHRAISGKKIFFELEQESEGTKRLLMFLGPVFSALDRGALVVIDELNASLHTQVCEAVLALFSSPETNPKGAQLIATTHDTNLLCSRYLRRDQIWFTEKDKDGATHLYPLTDFRTRKGDNIGKGYLQGRFGAVPIAGPVSDLVS